MQRTSNRARSRTLARIPRIESLEDRAVPATFGVPWGDPSHLSLSFAPDGTKIIGHTSTLFQTLDPLAPTSTWQRAILSAFQTWAVEANINIGLKPDGGQPIGVAGKTQHDPRFGDVRVVAQPMAPDALAISVPGGSIMSGTWSGDLFLNSLAFAGTSPPDLFGVALHEAGHVFGQDNSSDPLSPMFSHLSGATKPTAGDIASLQGLFGARRPDLYEGSNGNDTPNQAASFPIPGGFNNDRPLVLFADLTTATDADVFAIKPSSNYAGAVTVRLQSAGISLLAPHLIVTDASGKVLGDATADSGFGDSVSVHIPSVTPGATYFLKVDSDARDVFNVGAYGLAVTFDGSNTTDPALLDRVLSGEFGTPGPTEVDAIFRQSGRGFLNNDNHTDDNAAEAIRLTTPAGFAPNAHYEQVASISDAADVDYYRVRSVKDFPSPTGVMTVRLRSLDDGGTPPSVEILDGDGQAPVASRVLSNGDGTYTVEAAGIAANTWYDLRVAGDPGGAVNGNYELVVDFSSKPADLTPFALGTIADPATPQNFSLYVASSELFDLLLTAGPSSAPGAGTRLLVRNADGIVVYALAAGAGKTVSADSLFLIPGTYSLEFSNEGSSGPIDFLLSGQSISDPVGPALLDPTLQPIFPAPGTPTSPPIHAFPGGVISTKPFLIVTATKSATPPPQTTPPPTSTPPPVTTPPPSPTPSPTPDPGPTPGPIPAPPAAPVPPSVTGISAIGRSKKGMTSITVAFNASLDAASANRTALYHLFAGVRKRGKIVYTSPVHIRSVQYDGNAHSVTINLARPFRGALQVSVNPGIASSSGTTTSSPFAAFAR